MTGLTITSPAPLQVLQRATTGAGLGEALLVVQGHGLPPGATLVELRTVAASEAWGHGTDWLPAAVVPGPGGSFEARVVVPAGGWFRVELRAWVGADVAAETLVEPVGFGEVFVVAGQSYAVSCHEAVTTVDDPLGRVVASCPEEAGWRIAHDPQPGIVERIDLSTLGELDEIRAQLDLRFPHGPHSPFKGSIWPTVGNALVAAVGVPVALVHTAVGATKVSHWRKGTQLFGNLCDAVALAGDYRAVLWQQGESDVMAGTPPEDYRDSLVALRQDLVAATGLDRPWLPAKSTHHPTSLRPEADERPIRDAVAEVWQAPGFRAGPDTDTLRGIGEHRAVFLRGGHFTAQGQRAAGQLWADVLIDLVGRPPTA